MTSPTLLLYAALELKRLFSARFAAHFLLDLGVGEEVVDELLFVTPPQNAFNPPILNLRSSLTSVMVSARGLNRVTCPRPLAYHREQPRERRCHVQTFRIAVCQYERYDLDKDVWVRQSGFATFDAIRKMNCVPCTETVRSVPVEEIDSRGFLARSE